MTKNHHHSHPPQKKNTEHIGEILMYVSACTLKIAKPCSSFEVKQLSRRTILLCVWGITSSEISCLSAIYAMKVHNTYDYGLIYSSVLVLSQEGCN